MFLLQVGVELRNQCGHGGSEASAVIIQSHRPCRLRVDERPVAPKPVGTLDGPADSMLPDHLQDAFVHQHAYLAIQARLWHIGQAGAEVRDRTRAATGHGVNDAQPHRVQENSHDVHVQTIPYLVPFPKMEMEMRGFEGRYLALHGHRIYVEESGGGPISVVFESGLGFGRTSWDPVVGLLQDAARLVTYDRPGHGKSDRADGPTSIKVMAENLCQVVEATVQGRMILVAHSMGGLIARQAAPTLGSKLAGLLFIDPTPETAAMYDKVASLTRQQDRFYSLFQLLSHIRPLRRGLASVGTRSFRRAYPPATYATILAEDFLPSSFAQMRREAEARSQAVIDFREQPPPPPACPVILLSAHREGTNAPKYMADIQEHQRRYIATVEDGRFELVEGSHALQAERADLVAAKIRELVRSTIGRRS